jgi:hypothetical protein
MTGDGGSVLHDADRRDSDERPRIRLTTIRGHTNTMSVAHDDTAEFDAEGAYG